ncbi:MAG: anti-sigma factor [Flavobacteriaceae bacterium]|nr:anti-sigma factor [Flavobacteriaceae bacterium]
MNIKEYIDSGILELYVAGILSEKENEEVHKALLQYSELEKEVEAIESAIMTLTSAVSPQDAKGLFDNIIGELPSDEKDNKVITIDKPRSNWLTYTGWAASLFLTGGLIYTLVQNNNLKVKIDTAEQNQQILENTIEKANLELADSKQLITVLRDKDIIGVPLGGQVASPDAYAKVYWDQKTNSIYLDAQGLPDPPEGKVYQVWSLKLDPLTPTSLGVLDSFASDENKIFPIENRNASEAFGITLEPEGGSETPTLEQLYTLGTVVAGP